MELKHSNKADYYFDMLKHLSTDVKLELISRLSESLRKKKKKDKENEKEDDSWKDLFGAWESEESAEEIIKMIRESRVTGTRKIEDF